tara:strand:- start:2793 stop:3464 length:672 start_codon:yes stop_codon:yes gene_type:complete
MNKNKFIEFLLDSEVLRFGSFTTKSGRQTPYFINTGQFRTGEQISQLSSWYAKVFKDQFEGRIDNLYGPAYKGIPLATAMALQLSQTHNIDLSFTFNRKEAKDHGEGGVLVGDTYVEPRKVLIVEDVITAGTSVKETLEILKNIENVEIVGLIISVDRKEALEDGRSALQTVQEDYGIEVSSIINIEDIIAFVQDVKNRKKYDIAESQVQQMLEYRSKYAAQN